MQRPEFTTRWQLFAWAVPVIAVVASTAFAYFISVAVGDFVPVLTFIVAVGSAVFIASATGEISRFKFKVLACGVFGALIFAALQYQAVVVMALVLLAAGMLTMVVGLLAEIFRGGVRAKIFYVQKMRVLLALSLGFLWFCGLCVYTKYGMLALWYPIVGAAVTLVFPREYSFFGLMRAWHDGMYYAIRSVLVFLIATCVLFLIVEVVWRSLGYSDKSKIVALGVALMCAFVPAHYYYLSLVFDAVRRVDLAF